MKKRIWSVLLCAALLIGMLALPATAADTVLTIKLPDQLPKKGETFVVTVDLSGNPGVAAVQFTLGFDKSAMTCTSAKTGEVLSGALSATNPSASAGAIIAAASTSTLSENGTVAAFAFTAEQDLTALDFSLSNVVLSDGSNTAVGFTVSGGSYTPGQTTQPGTQPADPGAAGQQTATGDPATPGAQGDAQLTSAGSGNGLFDDTRSHWAREYIQKAVQKGLFKGYSDDTFRPDVNVSRVQFVTVLYRMAGSPAVADTTTPFTDIASQSAEFRTAIAWGYHNGYVSGSSQTKFSPTAALTREAAMKILYYYAGGQSGMETMFTSVYDASFKDSGKISSWAKAPLYWGVYNEIISGTSKDTLSPQGTATRAQLAKILIGYLEKTEVTEG